jgi:hypothetical protein
MIDLTKGNRQFVVPTTVHRNGGLFMGPGVKVDARDANHAKEVAMEHGHEPNVYFHPREVTEHGRK